MDITPQTVVIITGAASGIGRGCAEAFAAEGARVVVADINRAGSDETVAGIAAAGGEAIALPCDVGSQDGFEHLRDAVIARWGRVDVIMNNAGTILSGHPEDVPVSEWERVLNINLMSVVRSNAAFLPMLLEKRSGHIVNTSSFAGLFTYSFDRLPYAASKAAIFQMSEGLALYLRPKGIGVTVLCPGPVASNIMASTRVWTDGVQVRGPGPEFGLMQAREAGDQVVDAVRRNIFFLPTHPEVRDRLVHRATDFDAHLQEQIDNPNLLPFPPLRKTAISGDVR